MKPASLLSLAGGLILWELVARFIVKSTLIIVPPSHVVMAFADLVRQAAANQKIIGGTAPADVARYVDTSVWEKAFGR